MYSVLLDENGFFTGAYATVGSITNGIQVGSLPPAENSLCYKLADDEWVFSQERYDELEAEKSEVETRETITMVSLANRVTELESGIAILDILSEEILEGVNET